MIQSDPRLTTVGCHQRRQRLSGILDELRLDAILIFDSRDIYYFTGQLLPSDLPAAWILLRDRGSKLIAPEGFIENQVLPIHEFNWNYRGTRNDNIHQAMSVTLANALQAVSLRRIGIQTWYCSKGVLDAIPCKASRELVSIDSQITELQRRKDEDEISVIRGSILANQGAYAAVQDAIRPGVTELEVLAAGWNGAMRVAKEKVFHDGDYQCGQYNGPARNRLLESGELYIVDAWTCYRGYWSDMSRTFFVGTEPTSVQQELYKHIRNVLKLVEHELRPGVDGREIYHTLDTKLREFPTLFENGLTHHGGHCIGLRSHEMPDVNLERGGMLEVGNVVCIEPGGYFDSARYGVRLENMFLITESGCENLCSEVPPLIVCS